MQTVTFDRLLVFDKDGTLTETKSGKTFSESPEDQVRKFDYPNFGLDTIIGIATNQKGISLSFKDVEFLEAEINYLSKILGFEADYCVACPDDGENILVFDVPNLQSCFNNERDRARAYSAFDPNKHKHCFGIPESLRGTFRKPQSGMLLALEQISKWDREACSQYTETIEFKEKIFIGNSDSDRRCAEAAGFKYWDIDDWLKSNQFEKLC